MPTPAPTVSSQPTFGPTVNETGRVAEYGDDDYDLMPDVPCHLINLLPAIWCDEMSRAVLAVGALMAITKFLFFVDFSTKLYAFVRTLAYSMVAMRTMSVILGIMVAGFALAFHLAFGANLSRYRDYTESLMALFELMLGSFDAQELRNTNRYLGVPLFVLLLVSFVFVALSMLFAIVKRCFDTVRARHHEVNPFEDPLLVDAAYVLQRASETIAHYVPRLKRWCPDVDGFVAAMDTWFQEGDDRDEERIKHKRNADAAFNAREAELKSRRDAVVVPTWVRSLRSDPKLGVLKQLVQLEAAQRDALAVVEKRSAQARELALAASLGK